MFHFGYLTPNPQRGRSKGGGTLRCKLCGGFLIKKHAKLPMRFKCMICGNTFSINVPLPLHEDQGRRIDATTQAQMAADYLLGKPLEEIANEYDITSRTLKRIIGRFRKRRVVYIWRNPLYMFEEYDNFPVDVEREGRLYHDPEYGWEDLRRGVNAFVEAGLNREEDKDNPSHLVHIFDYLKITLLAKSGDYVIVPYYRSIASTLIAELGGGYGLDPEWGHFVKVKRVKIFTPTAENYDFNVQRLAQIFMPVSPKCGFEALFRMFPIVVVGHENRTFNRMVKRLMEN